MRVVAAEPRFGSVPGAKKRSGVKPSVTISSYLEEDHRRIETILQQAAGSSDPTEPKLYQEFRAALLRHIGMEEKILFPAIRTATGGESLPGVEQLHLDHG